MKELEYKIIGTAMMVEQEQRDRIFRELSPEYFSDGETREIFRTLKSQYKDYPAADSAVYLSALSEEGKADIVMVMDTLISPFIASEQLDDTLAAFKADHRERWLKSELNDLAIGSPTAADVLALADKVQGFEKTGANAVDAYLREYHNPIEVVPTGFSELDYFLSGGFIRGTLATIGARPSTGKTTFAINISTHDPTKKVLFISIEMSARMIYDRIISDKADLSYRDCLRHKVDYEVVKEIVGSYPRLKIVDDMSDIEDIEALIYAERPDLTVIDYIQIVTAKRNCPDNRQRIDYISGRLKSAAKKTGCTVVSLSQITRGGKDKPTMSDLKESGGLEQDSDYIILLYREYVNDKSNAAIKPEPTIVTLDKNKFGSTCELDMDFNGKRQRFTEAQDVITRPAAAEEEANEDLPF